MKKLLFLDFESFYAPKDGYGLKEQSVVEYVRDARFKAHGLGYAWADKDSLPIWISGWGIANFCSQIVNEVGWPNVVMVGHNVKFDAFILRHVYECVPGSFIDTKGMSKAVLGKTAKSHHLATLAEHFGLQAKGVMKTEGIRDLTQAQETELAEYCLHDVWLCREIYQRLKDQFPENQYAPMSRTVEMFVSPKLVLNVPLLQQTAEQEASRRANIFKEIGIEKSIFASNAKFPKLLEERGFPVPYKPSPRKKDSEGKPIQIPALALGDPEFLELGETENEELRTLIEARIAAKSTLLETRSAKLAKIGATGRWPFDVEFSGADQTHRFSGGSGAGGNPQNFTRGSALRRAVEAPTGFELVVGDFCVVPESRILKADLTWNRADQIQVGDELVGFDEALPCQTFQPSFVTGKSVKKAQCRTIRTDQGNVTVSTDHGFVVKRRLPTGGYHREWVKAVDLQLGDEIVFFAKPWETDTSRDGGWLAGIFDGEGWVSQQKLGFGQNDGVVLDAAVEKLQERGFTRLYRKKNKSGCNQIIVNGGREHLRLLGMLRPVRLMKKQRTLWENRRTWHNAENLAAVVTEVSFGGIREVISFQTSTKTFISDGMFSHNCNIELRLVAYLSKDPGLVQAIERHVDIYCDFASVFYGRHISKSDKAERHFGKTAILGLGYGMGWAKFIKTVRVQTGQTITEEESRKAVDLYRTRYGGVPRLWEMLDGQIGVMTDDTMLAKNIGLPVQLGYQKLWLPSGLTIKFPNLRQEQDNRGMEWVYDVWEKGHLNQKKLYGGKLLENIAQGLAGELCKEAMMKMDGQTGQVHDEIHVVCKKGLGQVTAQKLKRVMSLSPTWLPQMQLEAEVGWGKTWADAK